MNIPKPIAEFFRLKNEHNAEDLVSLFSKDAVVIDSGEGLEIQGHDEIRVWVQKSISGLNLKTEISTSTETDSGWLIGTIVSGDFKSSPARFEYIIILEGDSIQSLRIDFRGSLN